MIYLYDLQARALELASRRFDNQMRISMRCTVCGTPDPVMSVGPIVGEVLCWQCRDWLEEIAAVLQRRFMH